MTPDITLSPLTDDHAAALRDIRVKDFQQVFSGQPADHLDAQDALDTHVILRGDRVVGMFRIDGDYHLTHTFAQASTPGLRRFIVDQNLQGNGIGTAATRLLRPYMRDRYPRAIAVYLTVNLRNPSAYKAYTKGGFMDTGSQYLLGHAGPQHILRLPLI